MKKFTDHIRNLCDFAEGMICAMWIAAERNDIEEIKAHIKQCRKLIDEIEQQAQQMEKLKN